MLKMHLKLQTAIKCLFVGLIPISNLAFAQELECQKDYEKHISNEIQLLSKAFNYDDLDYIEKKTDPSLVNLVGGEANYRKLIEASLKLVKQQNIVISNIVTQAPNQSYVSEQNEICFVPKQTTILINGKDQRLESSFMLAVRPLSSKEWKYIDGSGLKKKPEMFYSLFPNFSRQIKLPFLK